jgi:hypothetical protein
MAQALYNDKNDTVDEICKTLNISRATQGKRTTIKIKGLQLKCHIIFIL